MKKEREYGIRTPPSRPCSRYDIGETAKFKSKVDLAPSDPEYPGSSYGSVVSEGYRMVYLSSASVWN